MEGRECQVCLEVILDYTIDICVVCRCVYHEKCWEQCIQYGFTKCCICRQQGKIERTHNFYRPNDIDSDRSLEISLSTENDFDSLIPNASSESNRDLSPDSTDTRILESHSEFNSFSPHSATSRVALSDHSYLHESGEFEESDMNNKNNHELEMENEEKNDDQSHYVDVWATIPPPNYDNTEEIKDNTTSPRDHGCLLNLNNSLLLSNSSDIPSEKSSISITSLKFEDVRLLEFNDIEDDAVKHTSDFSVLLKSSTPEDN